MRAINPDKWFRKGIKFYRKLRYRKGFGVHSPFVFHLITRIIDERNPYYCFSAIEAARSRLLGSREPSVLPCKNGTAGSVVRFVRCEAVTPAQGALLFRLANYFKSKQILQIGTDAGISTMYLSACAPDVQVTLLEDDPVRAGIARKTLDSSFAGRAELIEGAYSRTLPAALQRMPRVDFVFFHTVRDGGALDPALFREAVRFVHAGTIFVIRGIRADRAMKAFWEEACAHPAATVTVDLYSLGLIFFDPKLYKRNYIVYF